MKKLSFIFSVLILMVFIFSACEKDGGMKPNLPAPPKPNDVSTIEFVKQTGSELTADLYAGKTTKVGTVLITASGGFISVKYQLYTGYYLTETHLSVTGSLQEVPKGSGNNPKVGLFAYSMTHDPAVNSYTYTNIPVGNNQYLYILAHAVVKTDWVTDLKLFEASLPETATLTVGYPYSGAPSYFKSVITNGGILDGEYEGWCLDNDHVIYSGTQYTVQVISSYEKDFATLTSGYIDIPQNIDKVNWILNQNYVGTTLPNLGTVTFGDVQRAIWQLIEDGQSSSGIGNWSPGRVEYILTEAGRYGDGFVPHCGDKIAVVLKPLNTKDPVQMVTAQVSLIQIPQVCLPNSSGPETAWSAGYDFGGSNWAKYFIYKVY